MKTAIITDSTAVLPGALAEHPDVYQVNLSVQFPNGTTMEDTSNKEVLNQFYQTLETIGSLPVTSQPSLGTYYQLVDELLSEGYDSLLAIHLSGNISGTFSTAQSVLSEYADQVEVYAVDSKAASVVMSALVQEAIHRLEAGQAFTEVVQALEWLVEHSTVYLMVEDLMNLQKGGRLSMGSAMVGQFLKVRPLLYFDTVGKIQVFEKIRTNRKVYQRWVELAQEAMDTYPDGVTFAFAHAAAEEDIMQIEALLRDALQWQEVIDTAYLSPVIGTHTGKGAKGFAIIPQIPSEII